MNLIDVPGRSALFGGEADSGVDLGERGVGGAKNEVGN